MEIWKTNSFLSLFLEQAVFYHVAAGRKSVVAQRGEGESFV